MTVKRKLPQESIPFDDDTLRPHYDFSGGIRGKHAAKYARGTNTMPPMTNEEAACFFHGAWRFVSSVQTLADGSTRPNPGYGLHGVGNIIYTPQGRMMVFIMDPNRAPWAFDAHPTEPELREATKGFLAYGGRYEVHPGENAAEGYVLHHVDLEPSPNRVGKTLQRFYTFAESENGTRLILRAAPPLPAGVVEYAITWERILE